MMSVAIAPTFPDLSMFGGLINVGFDRVQVTVLTASTAGPAVDTLVPFPADSATIRVSIRVPLQGASDSILVQVSLLAGVQALFFGQATALVTLGPPPGQMIQVPLNYVGPGSQVASLTVLPSDTVVTFSDSVLMTADGLDASGATVPQFYVSWNTTDPTVAMVNGEGLLRAPAVRGVVGVQARTPNGVTAATTVTFAPPATGMIPIAGDGQVDRGGVLLPQPLIVEVRAADGLGVKGVAVQFRALDPLAAVVDPLVLTDDAGRAQTSVMLGNAPGPYSYEASAPGLGTVTFNALAN